MSLERLALGREVGAEVRAAALLTRERGLRDEPREQVRRVEQAPEPLGVADEAAVAPERRAQLRVSRLGSGASRDVGKPCGKTGLGERGERRAAAEDEALEQRVRREAVRAVHAGRSALAGRVEPGSSLRPSRSVRTPPTV